MYKFKIDSLRLTYDVVNQARYCPIKLRRICGHKFNANREIINSIQASYWNPRPKGINVVFPKWYDTAHLIFNYCTAPISCKCSALRTCVHFVFIS
jgi:hypothetical protein